MYNPSLHIKHRELYFSLARKLNVIKRLPKVRFFTTEAIEQNKSKALLDTFGRFHNYLRISLTEKCNLRCQYCMPEHGVDLAPKEHLLSYQERCRTISLFASLGVNKLRFTGGEPTVSKDLSKLIEHAAFNQNGRIHSIGITSNGIILNNQLPSLQKHGLTTVNISLDTLQEEKFGKITRREGKLINKVFSSIFTALSLNLPVKVNCVVMRGVNDQEIVEFVKFAMQHDITVRFIELMPFDGNNWDSKQFVSYMEIIDRLKKENDIELVKDRSDIDKSDTTKWFKINGTNTGRIGFITSMSSNFCGGCNRLRITADGKLKVCLFGEEGLSIRDCFRDNLSDDDIINHIHNAVQKKKAALGGHGNAVQIAASSNRPMILIGG